MENNTVENDTVEIIEPATPEIIEYDEWDNSLTLSEKLATATILTVTYAAGIATAHLFVKIREGIRARRNSKFYVENVENDEDDN